MKAIWLRQRHELQELAKAEGLSANGESGSLRDSLAFAEMLTLARDLRGVVGLMREDTQGALSFLEVVKNLDDALNRADALPSTSELVGPFHELADFTVEFLAELRKMAPEKFE